MLNKVNAWTTLRASRLPTKRSEWEIRVHHYVICYGPCPSVDTLIISLRKQTSTSSLLTTVFAADCVYIFIWLQLWTTVWFIFLISFTSATDELMLLWCIDFPQDWFKRAANSTQTPDDAWWFWCKCCTNFVVSVLSLQVVSDFLCI